MSVTSLDHLANRSRLEWISNLNPAIVPAKNFRRSSIICTIGMFLGCCWLEAEKLMAQAPKRTRLNGSTPCENVGHSFCPPQDMN